jgi:hypothetical protein
LLSKCSPHSLNLIIKLVLNFRKFFNLLVSRLHLSQYLLQVNILKNLQVFHLVFQLANSFALTVLILLKPILLVIQMLKLHVELFYQIFLLSHILFGHLQFLPGDLFPLLGFSQLLPKVGILSKLGLGHVELLLVPNFGQEGLG